MELNPCLADAVLAAFCRMDVLDDQEFMLIQNHIDRCEECSKLISKIEADLRSNSEEVAAPYTGLIRNQPAEVIRQLHSDLRELPNLELLECLGEGGSGTVFLARCSLTLQLRAVKLVHLPIVNFGEHQRSSRDNLAFGIPDHKNVLQVELATRHSVYAVYEMPYVFGSNLEQFSQVSGGKLQYPLACSLMLQAFEGIGHLHKHGIIHRDIKPENIMLDIDGRIKIIDLGLAKQLQTAALRGVTQHTTPGVGTLDYSAPEQLRDLRQANEFSDQFSLGATLYRLISGCVPSNSDSDDKNLLRLRCPDIDEGLLESIFKMRHPNVDERFKSLDLAALSILPFADPMFCLEAVERLELLRESEHSSSGLHFQASRQRDRFRRRGKTFFVRVAVLCVLSAALGAIYLSKYWVFSIPATEVRVEKINETSQSNNKKTESQFQSEGNPPFSIYGSVSNWSELDGELVSVSDVVRGYAGIVFGNADWHDYEFSFDFTCSTPPICTSAFFHANDTSTNEFGLVWHRSAATYSIRESNYQLQRQQPMERLKADTWYSVRVRVVGGKLQGFLDDQLLMDCEVEVSANGSVGFLCYRRSPGEKTRFRNIRVVSTSGEELWSGTPDLDLMQDADFNRLAGAIQLNSN